MVADAELTAAFQEEIAEETIVQEEVADEDVEGVEEVEEAEVEEEIEVEDLIPEDHKERSQMGRKLAAFLRKSDKMEAVIAQQAELLERLIPKEEEDDFDEPVTRKELAALMNQKQEESTQYETDFKTTFHKLCDANDLTEDEEESIGQILLEKYNTKVVGDGKLDGAMNFEKARAEYFGAKKSPLKKGKAPGVIKKQVTKPKITQFKKLDAVSESYLKMIERLDGKEKADRLRKES